MSDQNSSQVHLTVTLPTGSVMIPSWLALLFVLLFVISSFGLFLVWNSSRAEIREIRSLQLYEQDIENVLIRGRIATREDFSPHAGEADKGEVDKNESGKKGK